MTRTDGGAREAAGGEAAHEERRTTAAHERRRTEGARSGVGGGDARLCERSEQPEGVASAGPATQRPRYQCRRLIVLTLAALTGLAVAAPAQTRHLLPVPASVQWGEGRLRLDSTFTVAVRGHSDARLTGAVYRMVRRLEARVGISLTHQPAGAAPRGPAGAPERSFAADPARATLVVEAQGPGQAVQTESEDESYALDVTATQAVLRAPTVVGVIRGLETFLQLVEGDRSGFSLPIVQIQDRPRFPWRGILIDVSRHFEPVAVIERNLDAMAAVKLNVLHWHLSDDQGFRVESRRFPKLHEQASDGLFYT